MKTYFLTRLNCGRIILDLTDHGGDVLSEIKADNWLDARSKVKETRLWHNPGYGWYER